MSLRFRTLAEMTADLRTTLLALVDEASQPRLRDVVVLRPHRRPTVADSLAQQCRLPGAAVVPGASEHPAEGARNIRRTRFDVYLLTGLDAGTTASSTALTTLVDAVVQRFLPAADTPHTQVVIAGVIWEPIAQAPDLDGGQQLSACITFTATDFRQERD